ncbi:ABC transporter substrate-binding protein [Gulosibacter hominis]|uniref:ABC transporter substrate-binding protein n=1 Tax=Gulosibacter hominis TaxID=2770504 RepID=UPI00191A2963|nr:ABC transporter substrate-binding protein [Gulosibacter hominis]
MNKWLKTLAVSSTLLLLTACASGSGGTDGEETASTAQSEFNLEVDPEIREMLPQEVLDRGYISVAADSPYPPFVFLDEDGETLIGADPEIAAALGQLMGVEFRMSPVAQANLIPGLSSGKYDLAMSGMADKLERQESVTFVDYMQNGGAFVVTPTAEHRPEKLEDLCGLSISVQSGTTMASTAAEQVEECSKSGKGTLTINEFQGQDQVLLAITSNRADVAMITAGSAAYMVSQSPEEFEVVSLYNDPAKLGIAVANGNDELVAAVEAGMKRLFEEGVYEEILTKWGLYEFNSIDAVTINDAKS